jgi:hypothetical protein
LGHFLDCEGYALNVLGYILGVFSQTHLVTLDFTPASSASSFNIHLASSSGIFLKYQQQGDQMSL